jgi:hypothetical protein
MVETQYDFKPMDDAIRSLSPYDRMTINQIKNISRVKKYKFASYDYRKVKNQDKDTNMKQLLSTEGKFSNHHT